MREEIFLCGKDKVFATNHCRAYDNNDVFHGRSIIEIDNILTGGIPFTDDYVTLLAEKICDMINKDLESGLTGGYKNK